MKTVDKALRLLDQFSLETREVGLSELSRMAGLDKAATRRLLVALASHGFIEQVAETRKYRLGTGFLRLARIREATVPVTQAAQEAADWLSAETNETVHVSLPITAGMTTIAYRLPNRGRVVTINPAETLPFHATASGLAFLAHSSDAVRDAAFALPRARIATGTLMEEGEIRDEIARVRADGVARTVSTYEEDVASLALPFFRGVAGQPEGAVAIAAAAAEMSQDRHEALLPLLREAVRQLETAIAGQG